MSNLKILRVPEVEKKTGLCKAQIYKMYRQKDFPKRVKMGSATGYFEHEVDAWLLSKQEGYTPNTQA